MVIELSEEVAQKVVTLREKLGIKSNGLLIDVLLREILIEDDDPASDGNTQ